MMSGQRGVSGQRKNTIRSGRKDTSDRKEIPKTASQQVSSDWRVLMSGRRGVFDWKSVAPGHGGNTDQRAGISPTGKEYSLTGKEYLPTRSGMDQLEWCWEPSRLQRIEEVELEEHQVP